MDIYTQPNSNRSKIERPGGDNAVKAPAPITKAVEVRPTVGTRLKNAVLDKNRLENVGDKIVSDLVVPGIQDLTTNLFQTITDVFMETVKTIIYGDDIPSYVDKNRRYGGGTNYQAISSGSRSGSRYGTMTRSNNNDTRPDYSNRYRSSGFMNYALPSRVDLDRVIRKMYDYAARFDGLVLVSTFYEILIEDYGADIDISYMDEKWGWYETDLDRAKPRRVREGYIWDLPAPKSID